MNSFCNSTCHNNMYRAPLELSSSRTSVTSLFNVIQELQWHSWETFSPIQQWAALPQSLSSIFNHSLLTYKLLITNSLLTHKLLITDSLLTHKLLITNSLTCSLLTSYSSLTYSLLTSSSSLTHKHLITDSLLTHTLLIPNDSSSFSPSPLPLQKRLIQEELLR